MKHLFVLYEHASGFGLFRVKEFEDVGIFLPQVEEAVLQVPKFKEVVNLVGFRAFTSAATALENINSISEGIVTAELNAFLDTNVPHSDKKKVTLGVADPKLGIAISEALGISVTHIGVVPEIIRGIRMHLPHFVKGLTLASMKQAELGLGHSYSRGKVKFNVNRADNMIIQSIALVDQLDKDINTFAMRMKEWYSYHFPELAKVVTDNYKYALCAHFIKSRDTLSQEGSFEKLEELTNAETAQGILDAARMSMGMDISPLDLMNIELFAKRVIGMAELRKNLNEYLKGRMNSIAPNISVLIGETVGARLISHAGSLTNLAKVPASTLQVLGAEKALFRALKNKTNTPKYGLIYHSSFITKAGSKNKGRISRFLANKCSIASRIDCFSDLPTNTFGKKLREQVEDRLKFFDTGDVPPTNVEVMAAANKEYQAELAANKEYQSELAAAAVKTKKKKKKKRKLEEEQVQVNGINGVVEAEAEPEPEIEEPPKKKKKKSKVPVEVEETPIEEAVEEEPATEESPKKKKKKKKKVLEESMEVAEEEEAAVEESFTEQTPKKKKKKKVVEE